MVGEGVAPETPNVARMYDYYLELTRIGHGAVVVGCCYKETGTAL